MVPFPFSRFYICHLDNDINYNAIVLAICSGHDFYTDVREKAAYVLDSVLWNPKMSGSLFEDGSFSSWQRFEKSSNYTVEFYVERGRVPDYRDASSMAAIYRLHSALANGGTEWSNFLEGRLEPSFCTKFQYCYSSLKEHLSQLSTNVPWLCKAW